MAKNSAQFWHSEFVMGVLQDYLDGKLSVDQGVALLPTTHPKMFTRYAGFLKGQREMYAYLAPDYDPTREKKVVDGIVQPALSEKELVQVSLDELKQREIAWADYFGLEREQTFDLRKIAAMFYASEQLLRADEKAILRAGLSELRRKSASYIKLWAERFGKYALAACLGEFRHRKRAGELKIVPRKQQGISRAAAQSAAALLWPDQEKVTRATEWIVEKFKDSSFFPVRGYGGYKWSVIAETFLNWQTKRIDDLTWGDYVWNLAHNGGVFFDKCKLFEHEYDLRAIFDERFANRKGDVRKWGAQWLHPEWKQGLDLLEIAELPAPEVG